MVEKFLNYLQYERNYSDYTLQRYEEGLRNFERFYKAKDEELTWETIDKDVIREWIGDLMDKGAKATTINGKLSAVRSFYRFALSRKLVDKDPAARVTGPKKAKLLPQFVREEDMSRLLDNIEWPDTFEGKRDRAILSTFYETGIRQAELMGLDDVSVDLSAGQLKVTGKRNKQRIVPFGDGLKAIIADYQECRDNEITKNCEALFLSRKGNRISKQQIYKVVKDSLTLIGVPGKKSPHVLRHTFATAMLNHEAGLESVQKLLGHASLGTTEIYTHTTFEQLKRVYRKAHPRADV